MRASPSPFEAPPQPDEPALCDQPHPCASARRPVAARAQELVRGEAAPLDRGASGDLDLLSELRAETDQSSLGDAGDGPGHANPLLAGGRGPALEGLFLELMDQSCGAVSVEVNPPATPRAAARGSGARRSRAWGTGVPRRRTPRPVGAAPRGRCRRPPAAPRR